MTECFPRSTWRTNMSEILITTGQRPEAPTLRKNTKMLCIGFYRFVSDEAMSGQILCPPNLSLRMGYDNWPLKVKASCPKPWDLHRLLVSLWIDHAIPCTKIVKCTKFTKFMCVLLETGTWRQCFSAGLVLWNPKFKAIRPSTRVLTGFAKLLGFTLLVWICF